MAKGKSKVEASGAGGSSGAMVSVSSATRALKAHKNELGDGKAPETLNIGATTLHLSDSRQYISNGGFIVYTYVYAANSDITKDGRRHISFNATSYKTPTGSKASGYSKRGSRIFLVDIIGTFNYAGGSSGGIGAKKL